MRIVSYNVRYFSQRLLGLAPTGGAVARIAAALTAVEPDVICLQEVETPSLRSRFRSPFDALAGALGCCGGRYLPVHRLGAIYGTGLAVCVRDSEIVRAELIP